jgi:hypothetical protein
MPVFLSWRRLVPKNLIIQFKAGRGFCPNNFQKDLTKAEIYCWRLLTGESRALDELKVKANI